MSKFIKYLIIALVSAQNIFAQSGWSLINTGQAITSMSAVDTSFIFASCGAGGMILKSTNGGLNWTIIQNGIVSNLGCISFINRDTGFAAGGSYIIKTMNSGVNWFTLFVLGSGDIIYNMKFFNSNRGIVLANYSNPPYQYYIRAWRTTDGGSYWEYNTVHDGYLSTNSVTFYDSLCYYVADLDFFARTQDGGITWSSNTISPTNTFNFMYNFVNTNTGFIVSNSSGLVSVKKTINCGTTFNIIYQQNQIYLYAGYFLNENTGYVAGTSGPVLYTTNCGANWTIQYSGSAGGLMHMYFVNNNLGFVYGGTLLRTSNGGNPLGIKTSSKEIPSDYHLFQNYPNPFNPSTTIEFEVKKSSRISLKVYSIDGREVDELLDYEKFPAGYYYADFNAGNLASGVYLYQMTGWTEDKKEIFIDTKKMMLIK